MAQKRAQTPKNKTGATRKRTPKPLEAVKKAPIKKSPVKKAPAKAKPLAAMSAIKPAAVIPIVPPNGGKLKAATGEGGRLLSTQEVAELYGFEGAPGGRGRKQSGGGQLYWDYNDKTGELMMSALIPDNIDTTYDYLKDIDELSSDVLNKDKEVELARMLFENEPICARTVEALIENAVTGGYVSISADPEAKEGQRDEKVKEAQKLCEVWLRDANNFRQGKTGKRSGKNWGIIGEVGGIENIMRKAGLCWFRDGDWVATEDWRVVEVPGLKGKYNLPIKITTHDKDALTFSSTGAMMGFDIIEYRVPTEIKTAIENPQTDADKIINDAVSDWMRALIKKGQETIPLPPERTTHLKRWGDDWKSKGMSYLRPFMHVMADKLRLRRLDRATIIGLVQQLVIMMLGDANEKSLYHEVDQKRFRLFQTALNNMKTMHWMAWAGTDIKIETVSPDPEILKFNEKYTEVDDDLKIATGMTQLLINGVSSGNAQRDWASFVGVMSKLENFRLIWKSWVEYQLRNIMLENKFEEISPVYNLKPLRLKDERELWMTRIQGFQAGLQGRTDTLHDLNKDPDSVIGRQLEEAELKYNETIQPPPSSNQVSQGRPGGVRDGDGQKKTGSTTKEQTEQSMLTARYDELMVQLKEIYTQMVGSVRTNIENENDKEKVIALILAGFAAFSALTSEMVRSQYQIFNPTPEDNRWEIEAVTWNAGYVQRFAGQVQNTIRHMLDAHERGEISRDILIFQINTYLGGQSYRVNLYAEEILAKVNLASKLENIARAGIEHVRPRTVGDDKVCPACLANEEAGTVMTLDEFFQIYPLHNWGRCYPEPVEEHEPHQDTLVVVGKK